MLSRRGFLPLTLVLPVILAPAQDQRNTFSASPGTISPGDEVTVRWKVDGASAVHLLGWGEVPAGGTKTIRLKSSTTLILVATTPAGEVLRSAAIEVVGVRGDESDFETNLGGFRYPYVCNLSLGRGYGFLADALISFMQDELHAVQHTTLLPSGGLQMQSSRVRPQELQANLGRPYLGRRVSYLIEIPSAKEVVDPKAVKTTLKTLIEIRRRLEPTWYPETDDALYREEASRFERLFRSSHG